MKRPAEPDRLIFEDSKVVARYANSVSLQAPEHELLQRIRPSLGEMDMLDLGVGAGRTARHFAPLARSYLGLDYSHAMIQQCARLLPGVAFQVADVRSLDFLEDESYDFVLFSYNGIDHLGVSERNNVLCSLRRILRPRGILFFSTHNTNFIPQLVKQHSVRLSSNMRDSLRSVRQSLRFFWHNPTLAFRLPPKAGIRVVDGGNSFRSTGVYYIRPDLQNAALARLGMEEVMCAGNDSCEFLRAEDERAAEIPSPWVYYFCRKPG